MTPEQCLFRALECERLAASSSAPAVKRALMASAALWRKMAALTPMSAAVEAPNTQDLGLEQTAGPPAVVQVQVQQQQQGADIEAPPAVPPEDQK